MSDYHPVPDGLSLDPCPFCGKATEQDCQELEFNGGGPPPGYSGTCGWCGATGPMGTGWERGDHTGAKKEAVRLWNERHPPENET